MKMRQLKHLKRRVTVAVKAVKAAVQTVTLYQVYRRKDDVLVSTVQTLDEANALVMKAKAAKKASLYVTIATA